MRSITERAAAWIENQLDTLVASCHRISGGSICDTWLIESADGGQYFLKTHNEPPAQLFAAEAAGLAELARCAALRTPRVLHHDATMLIMEYIEPEHPMPGYWTRLGQGLAGLHRKEAPGFGFVMDNYCGATPQPNPRMDDGFRFFAEARLLYQARRARDRELLESTDLTRVERIATELPSLLPAMPPVLIHGDLWSGNVFCAADARPVLVDPAAHWGWAEAEIAMTRLFGGFAPQFYDAYLETHPLQPGWEQRLDIYNLYHLLNHLNLFGTAYLPQVRAVLDRYA